MSDYETPMHRDTRHVALTYKGETITFDMPGLYCHGSVSALALLDNDPGALVVLWRRPG